ncbi:MAG TPA: DUF494 domain-containing protein [Gammaproteobacteria bacterium]|nr:DUF494 domain-containing protein [Gammaproteobacteria bacterium]
MIIKQSVVDVLMFLFERYLDDSEFAENSDIDIAEERNDVQQRLEQVGFQNTEINQALDWLDDLASIQESQQFLPVSETSIRIYSPEEKALINLESLGFISFLEQTGILTASSRELVLDRVIALGQPLDTEQIKWIIMIVLHSYPGEENAFAWMESLVFDDDIEHIQ